MTRGVYEQFGLDWTAEAEAAIEAIDRGVEAGRGRRSKHAYSLEDYGLTEDEVRARFS